MANVLRKRPSLHTQIMYWLGAYALLLTAAVFLHGFLVNEFAERLVWDSLLQTELDHHLDRKQHDPGYRWSNTDSLMLYTSESGDPAPPQLAALSAGVYDELILDQREVLVLVREVKGVRYTMVLDITELENQEDQLSLFVLGSATLLVLFMGFVAAWGLRRALRPLSDIAAEIAGLQPDRRGQSLTLPENPSSELVIIAEALNDYLKRNERFVERERAFIDITSHELRTPIAVIAGASELALGQPDLSPSTRNQVQRVRRTAREVEQMISLLLVLAKDPERLAAISDRFSLDQLLPDIVDDHRYLTEGKDLSLVLATLPARTIVAPLIIVQAAIGNLLRNAIENSDRGEIRISLQKDATVVIEDPGHGMSPEEISRIYAQLARGGGREGGGIGLDLISRLCEHLGWQLDFASEPGRGTRTTLRLRTA